jgi:hypothetical protein
VEAIRSAICSPMLRRSSSSIEAISPPTFTGFGSSGWRRAKASNRWVSEAARFAEVFAIVA